MSGRVRIGVGGRFTQEYAIVQSLICSQQILKKVEKDNIHSSYQIYYFYVHID